MNTLRIKIKMATRCDCRAPGSDQSDVRSVNPGEVYDVVRDVAAQLIAFGAAEITKDPTMAEIAAAKKAKADAKAALAIDKGNAPVIPNPPAPPASVA